VREPLRSARARALHREGSVLLNFLLVALDWYAPLKETEPFASLERLEVLGHACPGRKPSRIAPIASVGFPSPPANKALGSRFSIKDIRRRKVARNCLIASSRGSGRTALRPPSVLRCGFFKDADSHVAPPSYPGTAVGAGDQAVTCRMIWDDEFVAATLRASEGESGMARAVRSGRLSARPPPR